MKNKDNNNKSNVDKDKGDYNTCLFPLSIALYTMVNLSIYSPTSNADIDYIL